MEAIVCTLFICLAAVCMYWMYLNHRASQPDNELPPIPIHVHPIKDLFAKDTKSPDISLPPIPESLPTKSAGSEPEILEVEIIPKLAQDYLDAETKLIKRAQNEDMSGMSMIGDITLQEAAGCRRKAEKLIKEAN